MVNMFEIPEEEWETRYQADHLKVTMRRNTAGSVINIRNFATLPGIPKELAFRALSDFTIRKVSSKYFNDFADMG